MANAAIMAAIARTTRAGLGSERRAVVVRVGGVLVKKLAEPTAAAASTIGPMVRCVSTGTAAVALVVGTRSEVFTRAIEDLVELAAVQPHPSALRAVVDFDSVALGEREGSAVERTVHAGMLSRPLLGDR